MISACTDDEPQQRVKMPISISLPANEVLSAQHAQRRAPGDPGTTEQFLFPHHLYIIVISKTGESTWSLWHSEHRTLTDNDWQAKSYVGLLPAMGDSIYQYTEEIDLLLSGGKFEGRVYAVASAEELTFTPTFGSAISTLSDIEDMTFDASSAAIQSNLAHIYSSPYNLELDGAYFGSFNSTNQRVPHVSLLLYHVAAKVDITWYVDPEKRVNKDHPENAVRLTYLETRNLFNGNAYCFRPMENVVAAPLTSGASKTFIGSGDEGLWWEGRTYFYTLLYTTEVSGKESYFPLQMVMKTNGDTHTGYKPLLYMKIDKTSPFTPWLRANFNLSAPLAEGEATKTVDN